MTIEHLSYHLTTAKRAGKVGQLHGWYRSRVESPPEASPQLWCHDHTNAPNDTIPAGKVDLGM